mgnify:CR=1 FL=1
MKLLLDGKEYIEYQYEKEEEFEKDIVENSKSFFGEKTIYIDVKKRLKAKYNNGSIPDGYLFDYTITDRPKLYFIENELKNHSVRDHICPQMLQFALNYRYNLLDLKELLISSIQELGYDIDKIAKNANYRNADDMFTNIINNNKLNVIIPIDEISDELREAISYFNFPIDLREFKKYICGNSVQFAFESLQAPYENIKTLKVNSSDIDTIIVPADKEGFESEFLGNNCWFAISIGINMLDKLKYIVAYQKSPIGALTYYAEISNIELYKDTGKYIIYFKSPAVELSRKIPLNKNNPNKAPQSRVYTTFEKIKNATSQTTLDDIF